MKKQSIRLQVAATTILLIAVTILICILANALFIERVYTNNKKQSLLETYELLNTCDKEALVNESFQQVVLQNTCYIDNLKMIILDDKNYSDAIRETLRVRLENGGGHTGWSNAWIANVYARLGDGEKVMYFIRNMFRFLLWHFLWCLFWFCLF